MGHFPETDSNVFTQIWGNGKVACRGNSNSMCETKHPTIAWGKINEPGNMNDTKHTFFGGSEARGLSSDHK